MFLKSKIVNFQLEPSIYRIKEAPKVNFFAKIFLTHSQAADLNISGTKMLHFLLNDCASSNLIIENANNTAQFPLNRIFSKIKLLLI